MARAKKDAVYLPYKGNKPYSSEKIIEGLYAGEPPPYDRESLFRYIGKVLDNETKYDADTIAATKALRDALVGVDLMKQVGIKWKKISQKQEDIHRETIHHPAFTVVMAALNNEFPDDGMTQRQHAVAEIENLF